MWPIKRAVKWYTTGALEGVSSVLLTRHFKFKFAVDHNSYSFQYDW